MKRTICNLAATLFVATTVMSFAPAATAQYANTVTVQRARAERACDVNIG